MIIDSAVYSKGERVVDDVATDDFARLRELASQPGDFVWIGLHDPTERELRLVAQEFDLHPLAAEDAFTAHQRPKFERYDGTLFLTVKTMWYIDKNDAVETGEINLFVGESFVVVVRHGEGVELSTARHELEARASVLSHGPSAVVYAVCDLVVDGYLSVMSSLEEDVDEVEKSVFSPGRTNDSTRIYRLKREIAEARRAILPLREPMQQFASGSVFNIDEDAAPYFRDITDHLSRAAETVDGLDNLLSTAFDAHLAQVSVRQNDDMRKISAALALVVAPTLIAGIYGMNFHHMPERTWTYGYVYALLLMIGSVAALWVLFKRSGWL